MKDHILPALVMDEEDALLQLNEQILIGEGIRLSVILSTSDFTSVKKSYYSWNEYNETLLLKMFDNSHFRDEYRGFEKLEYERIPDYEIISEFQDRVEEKIRRLESIRKRTEKILSYPKKNVPSATRGGCTKGSLFIAMPMSDEPGLPDVLNAIKAAASDCGLTALRIDDDISKEPITPRILAQLRTAEFVVADLTYEKASVYYEAGFAEALDNTPIYIARKGTKPAFDTKDYPVLFFETNKELTEELKKRLTEFKKQNEQ